MKRLTICLLLLAAVTLIFGMTPAHALKDDDVLSQHISEADGTSGQDTNTGSGVKTGHIQDAAVTSAKIADGAVTDAKITGPISASKISSTGLDADTVDGLHASDLSKKYDNVIVVSADGNGDFTSPLTAMSSITDASSSNTYLMKVMPGVYDNGFAALIVKDYVDIEGSGKEVTKITSPSWGSYCGTLCYPASVDHTELRDITIESYAGAANCGISVSAIGINSNATFTNVRIQALDGPISYAMNIAANGTPTLNNVELISDSPTSACTNISLGINLSEGASVFVKDSTIDSFGGANLGAGIQTYMPTSVTLINNDIYAEGTGLILSGSTTELHNSRITGGSKSVNVYPNTILYGAGSQLNGTITNSGTFKCFNCYDGNFDLVTVP